MPKNENQIKTRLAKLASQEEGMDSREPFPDWPLVPMERCPNCGWEVSACDCSRYDSEGNEL